MASLSVVSLTPVQNVEPDAAEAQCLLRAVADALAEDPALEAVSINAADQTVSVATFGKPAAADATRQMMGRIQAARAATRDRPCNLLSGEGDCTTCDTPLSAEERRKLTIQQAGPVTTIARVTCPTAPKFWRWAAFPLPRVVQRDVEFLEHADEADEWKPQLVAAILCGLFGLGGYLLQPSPLALPSFILAYIAGGWFTSIEVWERLRKGAIDVHFLMLAVAAGSASIGAWNEGAILLFLFSLSGALEHFALGRTQREIRSLFKDAPKFAAVLDAGGHEVQTPVQNLLPGMRLLVKPGAQFPVDAEVVKGQTAADESNLTGEATPVEKGLGDTVLAGTLNLWGAVEAVVVRTTKESALEKIVRLIREAQQQKAPAQLFADRFGTYYTYAVLALSVLMFFVWWMGFGLRPFTHSAAGPSAFYRAMTLLVVASPCALVLSIPSAVLAAIAWSARRGILFRGGVAVEKLADIRVVALDKTGTLTTGELRVERVESFPAGREGEIAQLAYSLERLSTHPLARAVTRFGKQQQLKAVDLTNFESVTGQGLRARRNGEVCVLGRREWVVSGAAPAAAAVPPTQAGFSEIWLSEGDLIGRVILRDDIRPAAQKIIGELRREGLRTVVLTGDRKATAEHLQHQLQLDDVRAELKPEDKVAIIQSFAKNNQHVAMIGDGVNDAPSLAAAYVGVAMGARGSDAALEQADVVLMHDRLENFLAAFRLSQRARRIIRQNLFISLGTVATLVTFALFGGIPLTVGVIGHEGSTVIVVMNSLRLLFQGKAA